MKDVIVIGAGIAGMSCAVTCAGHGMSVILVAPFPSERAQSVMAMGGINAVTEYCEEGDSVESHINDTLKGGSYIAGREAVSGLCIHAKEVISYLEDIGTVFSVDRDGRPARRAFGGQSHKRTYYCGASTGKQIVSSLIMEVRRFEAEGLIKRRLYTDFYSALIKDGRCYGALLFDERAKKLEPVYADALVIATGGQNALFGKTTGTIQNDGFAAGKLFMQGVELKNLEFIQYHPTTIETSQKKMLISEAVRGEGGRLFYMEGDERVYFMEDKYGPHGNLMTRDVVAREIYNTGKDVFLDIAFLGKEKIHDRLLEVQDVCSRYRGIDITREPIPVTPSVHFFMGGIAVKNNHESNIHDLFAIGEAASIYHGANRLGGNSLLAALYSGRVAANELSGRDSSGKIPDFGQEIRQTQAQLAGIGSSESSFPVMYIRDMAAEVMTKRLGIVRNEENLREGIRELDYYLSVAERIRYDNSVPEFLNYSLIGFLTLGRAVMESALGRKESRGSHYRSDYPQMDQSFACSSLIKYDQGSYRLRYDRENEYES